MNRDIDMDMSMAVNLPLLTTSSTCTPASLAMYPKTVKITNPPKMLVPQFASGITSEYLEQWQHGMN